MVIGYQVDGFTHTWSAEQVVAPSLIYSGFTGEVSSLNHFPFEPGCEDYLFLYQAVADFEWGLDSISLITSRHQKWILPLMSPRSLLLPSHLGFSTQYCF